MLPRTARGTGHACSSYGGVAPGDAGSVGSAPALAASKLERDVEPASYAVIEPESSNLNIDSVVLTCAAAGNATALQLQIYLSTCTALRDNRQRGQRPA